METIIAVISVIIFMVGILLFAKKIVKPPKGPLPDCCGPNGNRDVNV